MAAQMARVVAAGLSFIAAADAGAACAGGACEAMSEAAGGLSMLQKGAGRSGRLQQLGRAVPSGPPRVTQLPGASVLCMKFAVPASLHEAAAADGRVLGEPREGGFQMDESGHVLVSIAHFPDAPMGWSGEAGASDVVSVPHHLFRIQVPIAQKSHAVGQTAYALVDDDTAMNLYRMGAGVPAKLANISTSPAAAAPGEATDLRVSRRGLMLFEAKGIVPAADPDVGESEIHEFFQRPDANYPLGMSMNFPLPYIERAVRPLAVHSVKRVSIGEVTVSSSDMESLRTLLGEEASLVSAFQLHTDLEVSMQMQSVPQSDDTYKSHQETRVTSRWRQFGNQVTTLDKGASPRSYQNGDITWAKFKMNAAGLAPYLPPGAVLDESEEGCLWLTRWQPADVENPWSMAGREGPFLLEYNELWVQVPVLIKGQKLILPLTMLLDDDVAQNTGRDAGCPKKLANLTYTFSPQVADDADVHININRKGRPVYSLTGRLGEKLASEEPIVGVSDSRRDARPMVFTPTTDFSWNPELSRPNWFMIKSANLVAEQRPLHDVEIELGNGPSEPLAQWFTGPPTRAGYVRMDQDWMMARGPAYETPIDFEGYQEWWRKSFAVLYM